ncbi:3'-5' exonuclease [Bradyrhizobium sp. 151]|uniref:3'-5' exonuclease n=1 Tax=Bradyrhizobium sp. 151 TaxID=2782626 RepID=UPI001FFBE4FF|nr:3'-5' exonuclease [Bradyrhizobium sp. 151]MCK1656745.1 3'-5' exonuclease [Bradyrhizobium sp. 151]
MVDLISSDRTDLAMMAEALAKSPDYRVLRRLVPRTEFAPSAGQATKAGILLDVETTGLDTARDEVIELAMVKFEYLADDRITRITDVFSSLNEPSTPISAEITELTGITDEMVLGQQIDPEAVSTFASEAVVVVAHNASFDRKFAERYWSIFERKAWACSATEVDWRKLGFDGSRLGYLLNGSGLFHQAHRAIDDCRALIEILSKDAPRLGRSAFALLLERARRKTVRIWAEQSPFELKDALKKRGYRWSDGADGRPRSWYIDVDEHDHVAEIEFLRKNIYLQDSDPRIQFLSAINRFSKRV